MDEIDQVVVLAKRIWTRHYVPLIGLAQVEYMLERFQSSTAIKRQIEEGHEYFLIRPASTDSDLNNSSIAKAIGYMDVLKQPEANKLFLSKLYVNDDMRSHGYGRQLFNHALGLARHHNLSILWLTVYKFNPSLQTYLRWNMVNTGSIVKDIGDGFVMDDYQLEIAV